ncbi:MAG: HAMP domain-containing histidine kinase [Cyanobacteria bacterium]|nr:HAMP domain-containing histidine kinase [Cyanobacteriota bacterium]
MISAETLSQGLEGFSITSTLNRFFQSTETRQACRDLLSTCGQQYSWRSVHLIALSLESPQSLYQPVLWTESLWIGYESRHDFPDLDCLQQNKHTIISRSILNRVIGPQQTKTLHYKDTPVGVFIIERDPQQNGSVIQENYLELESVLVEILTQRLYVDNCGRPIAPNTDYISTMAHELRTPLHSIIASSSMALEEMLGPLTDKQTEYLRLIYASGEHLLELINNLLDISRLRSGKLKLNHGMHDLNELISHVQGVVESLFSVKSQTVCWEVSPHVPKSIWVDKTRAAQILINLLSNAHKYCPKGAHVHVRVSRDNTHVQFEVEDNGPGIPQCDIERVFLPFEQVHCQVLNKQGTGLGLPIARKIAELHGGSLTLCNRQNKQKGCCFCLRLPTENLSRDVS